ncbi:MAG TPA: hypothetical protein VM680_18750 [Verrucomicrobiae bacterium]|nr:hypothetical protein [Verrucomicrobiae bacterium]
MLLFFKRILAVMTVALAFCQTSHAFALLGPHDTWQISALGYDPQGDNGDLGGPKNTGEEWRWTLPRITYAYDPSFIDFFGTNGIAAVEEAIFLFNKEMTNFTALTDAELRKKPLDTRRIHQTAQALGVLDLKSSAMGTLAEQLGLAGAERWTWALRGRAVVGPTITNYLVIKRNFDPYTYAPSSFVNGRRLTYRVGVFPAFFQAGQGVFYEDAVEFHLDQTEDAFLGSLVSSLVGEDLTGAGLRAGEYFSALTQDDIGGLRYMYSRNNLNIETLPPLIAGVDLTAPAIRVIDTNALTFITGVDAFTFFNNISLTNNPAALIPNFTNGLILATNVSVTNIVSTNFVVTNLVAGGLFMDTSKGLLITNFDLFIFSEDSRTNPAPVLQALWPGLIITKTNSSFVTQIDPVLFFTNAPWATPFDPPVLMTNYVTNIVVNYRYEYANVITNYASAVTDLEIRDIFRAPWSTPDEFVLTTNITTLRTNLTSGGFYILDRSTNAALVGYSFVDENNVPLLRSTNIFDSTAFILVITNFFDPLDYREFDLVSRFTNVVYAAFPIFLNSSSGQQLVSVVTTNQVIRYDYVFDTNQFLFFPPANGNTNVILQTITFTNGGPVRITTNFVGGFPSGSFAFLDTNQFVLAGLPPIQTFGLATNIVTLFTNAVTGEFITQLLIYQTNSILFAVYPITFQTPTTPMQRPGVDSIQFVQVPYLDFFNQTNSVATNFYSLTIVTNGVASVQTVRRIATADIVFGTQEVVSADPFPIPYLRTIQWQRGTTLIPGGGTADGGPGQIVPGSVIQFSKLSPSFVVQTPGATTEETSFLVLQWGSFDSETLLPRLYPEDITGQLKKLEDIVLRRNPAP